ncbi:MAG: alpha-amylase family glycosyl hydrolase [Caulobacterales bacterium]
MSFDWRRGGVFYQIYPRSFCDSNADGIGDLKGAASKLDHIARLGCDGIWLSPFFPSPMKDYGYDVSDYCGVDPMFGTLADFDALLKRAHDLGLKVIIDQVYSHSSDAHQWFAESRASRDSSKSDWYVWADAKPDGSPPNNWQALFGGPAWTWDARRRQYYFHNFLPSQPDLNVRNPDVANALLDAARFWFERGVDGVRLDVVNFYTHDALLRDNPAALYTQTPAQPYAFQTPLYSRSQSDTLEFIPRLRALADSYGDRFLLGEIEDPEPLTRQKEYTAGANRLHSAYSFYLLRQNHASPRIIAEAMRGWSDADGAPAWSLSNHDVPRFPTRLANDDAVRIKQIMALLLCLRGVIFLYQGDELGLPNAHVPFERLRDPEAIAFWPHGIGRDGARTPMPWTANAPMAGFTQAADAWLPLDPRHRARATDQQETDPDSMLAFTRHLIGLRKTHPALNSGDWTLLEAGEQILAFTRTAPGEKLIGVFNLGGETARCQDHLLRDARIIASLGAAAIADDVAILPKNAFLIAAGA